MSKLSCYNATPLRVPTFLAFDHSFDCQKCLLFLPGITLHSFITKVIKFMTDVATSNIVLQTTGYGFLSVSLQVPENLTQGKMAKRYLGTVTASVKTELCFSSMLNQM